MKSIVSIVRCAEYRHPALDEALGAACLQAGFPEVGGKTVLVKPNILIAADPDAAVTTHPEFLRSALRFLKNRGAKRILVGDSPSWQFAGIAERKSGLRPAAEAEGAEWVDFSQGARLDNPGGRFVKNFFVAEACLEADLIISLPKLKNHNFVYFTGSMKNLFGTVPGMQKAQFHLRFPDRRDFGTMLVDLCIALKPAFSLMDGIVGMEGPGPGSGTPRRVGLVLASRDCLALDRTAARILGYDPADIFYLEEALQRKFWISGDTEIELSGEPLESAKIGDWIRIPKVSDSIRAKIALPRLIRNLFVPRPFFSPEKCVACGGCVTICPAKALEFAEDAEGKKYVEIDSAACIRCYCCHEVCPEKAILLRTRKPGMRELRAPE